MKIDGLVSCNVVSGEEGLDRIINHITVMEIPDVIEWLKGNDLLLTSLFPIKDNEEALQSLIEQLDVAGSSGLAIKNRYFPDIPEILISESNRLGFPIIEIRKDISYLEIMNPLMSIILDKGYSEKKDLEEFFKWITELAMDGKGAYKILEAVGKFLENYITVESEIPLVGINQTESIQPLNYMQIRELKSSKRPVRMVRILNRKEISCIVTPLFLNEEIQGYITLWETKREFQHIDFIVLERVIPLFALEFLKIKTKIDVEQNYKDEFLFDILLRQYNDKASVIEKAKIYNWDLTLDYQVVVLDVDHFQRAVEHLDNNESKIKEYQTKLFRVIEKKLAELVRKYIVVSKNHRIVILIDYRENINKDANNLKEVNIKRLKTLQERLKKELPDVTFTMGIGRFYKGLNGISLGYKEALQSINLGRIVWGRDTIIHFNDLGIYRILAQFNDQDELDSLFNETIGILVDYDNNNNSHLVNTLTEYFNHNHGLIDTANKLYIHVNTLKYRLKKIEELTGFNINETDGRLRLHLGLKIFDMKQFHS